MHVYSGLLALLQRPFIQSRHIRSILFGTHQRFRTSPATPSIHLSDTAVELSDQITSLGVVTDSSLSSNAHLTALCKACQFHLRSLRHIRRSLTDDMAIPIDVALVKLYALNTAT